MLATTGYQQATKATCLTTLIATHVDYNMHVYCFLEFINILVTRSMHDHISFLLLQQLPNLHLN